MPIFFIRVLTQGLKNQFYTFTFLALANCSPIKTGLGKIDKFLPGGLLRLKPKRWILYLANLSTALAIILTLMIK